MSDYQHRYNHSEKGRARWNRYRSGPAGMARDARYNLRRAIRRLEASRQRKASLIASLLEELNG